MPKFKTGAPQLTFSKKNGGKFTMTYHSRTAAVKSFKAMRSKGAKVLKMGAFNPNKVSKQSMDYFSSGARNVNSDRKMYGRKYASITNSSRRIQRF